MISQPGFQLLRRIQEADGLQIGELARLAEMDPAATGRQIGQLEADGLVTRERDSGDSHTVLVRVTPAGAEVRRRLSVVAERHMSDVLSGWSESDRARLARLPPPSGRWAAAGGLPQRGIRSWRGGGGAFRVMPRDIGIVDLMIGFPRPPHAPEAYASLGN